MQLEDWLDDLCVRFIINLPPEELASVERICFQVEEAQWFYEDFIRPLDPSLPSLSLKQFSLRIFQHCPLFSQWSAQHHTTAFAEFLAYKQRVPVRGAIMLSEAMDEVVLVKGWKKGANWSFPRGKINKDENDLDCAIREVYEETGFDVKAAGLVRPEKEMKYIEVTMREQHMRLYVFKGVPKDTYFEPRTRKEISKIEWYKLHDLPTLKKKAHHENDEHPAINANKFYMVAPFLHPLKKWIAQQRKRDARYGSAGLTVPPVLAEESATENDEYSLDAARQHYAISPPALSSLPEVLSTQQPLSNQDPGAHLKELLNIGAVEHPTNVISQISSPEGSSQPPTSNALLALLRSGSKSSAQPQSQPPQGPVTAGIMQQALPTPQQNLLQLLSAGGTHTKAVQPLPSQPAPYQQTADLNSIREVSDETQASMVPPASDLPKLTHHTKALLDAFQNKPQSEHSAIVAPPQPHRQIAPQQQSLLDVLRGSTSTYGTNPMSGINMQPSTAPNLTELPGQNPTVPLLSAASAPLQSSSLLDLLRQPSSNATNSVPRASQHHQNAPVELAAVPPDSPKPTIVSSQDDFLAALFKKEKSHHPVGHRDPAAKVGQPGATITGPLNQPNLDNIVRVSPPPDQNLRRSPVPTSRVLYNPKQPTPVKILARPENKQSHPPRSPRMSRPQPVAASPKKQAKPHEKPQEKPFQPQILRRPQASESRQSQTPSPSAIAPAVSNSNSNSNSRRPSNLNNSSPPPTTGPRRVSEQSNSHKQTLLQLFGGAAPTAPPPLQKVVTKQPVLSPRSVSPAIQSHIVSPIADDPISTRSRVGSLASVISAGPGPAVPSVPDSRTKVEKRQTTAEDKAFLLNYLGKFANQES